MKTGIAVLTALLIFFTLAPVQAEQDAYLITQTSFGPWQIGLPGDKLLVAWSERFGKPDESGRVKLTTQDERYFFWHTGYGMVTVEGRILAIVVADVLRPAPYVSLNRKYHTPEGIHMGSTLSSVLEAYGPPDKTWKEYVVVKFASASPTTRTVTVLGMIWKARGLYLEIGVDSRVHAIGVSDFSAPWEECMGDLRLPTGCS